MWRCVGRAWRGRSRRTPWNSNTCSGRPLSPSSITQTISAMSPSTIRASHPMLTRCRFANWPTGNRWALPAGCSGAVASGATETCSLIPSIDHDNRLIYRLIPAASAARKRGSLAPFVEHQQDLLFPPRDPRVRPRGKNAGAAQYWLNIYRNQLKVRFDAVVPAGLLL
jgi:hypothetical protein